MSYRHEDRGTIFALEPQMCLAVLERSSIGRAGESEDLDPSYNYSIKQLGRSVYCKESTSIFRFSFARSVPKPGLTEPWQAEQVTGVGL